MWTPAARAQLARDTCPIAANLTDPEWALVAPFLPARARTGRPWRWPLRSSRDAPWPFVARCYVDRAYAGERVGTATLVAITVVGAPQGHKGFAVHPRRWVIERTIGWLGRCRRLARDHEATPSSALAFVVLAAAMILVRRLA